MPPRKSILLVGGGGQKPPSDGPPLPSNVEATNKTPEDLKRTLRKMIDEASEMGCDVRVIQLPDDHEAQNWVQGVKETLAGQSWDGFVIGNGIRGTPSLTVLFEELVQIAREVAPNTPIGFNTHPMDVGDTIRRMFPGRV